MDEPILTTSPEEIYNSLSFLRQFIDRMTNQDRWKFSRILVHFGAKLVTQQDIKDMRYLMAQFDNRGNDESRNAVPPTQGEGG